MCSALDSSLKRDTSKGNLAQTRTHMGSALAINKTGNLDHPSFPVVLVFMWRERRRREFTISGIAGKPNAMRSGLDKDIRDAIVGIPGTPYVIIDAES
jgi:hypothetical protein